MTTTEITVPSSRPGHGPYRVTLTAQGAACTCAAATYRREPCRHIQRVRALRGFLGAREERDLTTDPSSSSGMSLARRAATPQVWQMLQEQAAPLVKSGLLPSSVKTEAAALAIMLKGHELGMPPMLALGTIHVIEGKPTLSAEGMLALIYDRHGDQAVMVLESTAERCTVAYRRRAWPEAQRYSYTLEDAQRAGLAQKPVWKQHPAAMLRARVITAVGRMAFADVIAGLASAEEIGDYVEAEYTVSAAPPEPAARIVQGPSGPTDAATGELVEPEPEERAALHQAITAYLELAETAAKLGVQAELLPADASLERVQELGRELKADVAAAREYQRQRSRQERMPIGT